MKRILSGLIIFSFLFCFALEGYAADQLHRITHNDQDALVIGQINRQEDNDYIVNVLHVISGKLDRTTIKVSKDFKYEHLDTEPSIDDFGIFSLDKGVLGYKVKYGVYKADSGDYKTLKLIKTDISHGQRGDLTALEYYINSNGEEANFSFEDTTAYVTDKSGQRKVIYVAEDAPVEVEDKQVQENIERVEDNKKNETTQQLKGENLDSTEKDPKIKVKAMNKSSNNTLNFNYVYLGLILVFIIAIVFLVDKRTNKK